MNKPYYAKKGLFVGITSILCAFYFFAPTLFTCKSSLIEHHGYVENLNTFYTEVEHWRGSKSTKSELKFSLNSTHSFYVLMKNIGQSGYNKRFETLEKQLRKSKTVTVWIKESQNEEYKPTVFQIADINGNILYDFKESKSLSKFGFLISFGLGIFGIGLYLIHKYKKKPNRKTA
ncbi:hypothetical protein [Winogradskyella costae]|uniref:hypothetical protein n=1 Tax=Winogradskyella costae TaxID=2697008 RepID=UPI0015CDD53E|nr:hypothetical protein [Winogradskyella costae]